MNIRKPQELMNDFFSKKKEFFFVINKKLTFGELAASIAASE